MDKKSYLEQLESGDTSDHVEKAVKDLRRHQQLLKNLKKEWEIKERDFALAIKFPRRLVPEYEFQEQDEYWDIQKEYKLLEKERQFIEYEDKCAQLEKAIKAKKEEVDRLTGENNE